MRRLRSLDGLRGVAAVMVLLGHARLVLVENDPDGVVRLPGIAQLLQLVGLWGTTAVWLFFILSGVVLTRAQLSPRAPEYGRYVLSRLARLYVPVWAALALCSASMLLVPRDGTGLGSWVAVHPASLDLGNVLADATLIGGTGSDLTPLWTLRWEILFSLLLVAYVGLLRRVPARVGVLGCVALSAAGAWAGSGLVEYLPMFGVGVALAAHWDRIGARVDQLTAALRRPWPGVPVGLLLGAALLGLQFLPEAVGLLGPDERMLDAVDVVCQLASLSVVVLVVALTPVRRLFETRLALWLGTISFSLYLTHETVLLGFVYASGASLPWLLVAVVLAVPMAWLFFRFVESRAHTIARRIKEGPSAEPVAPRPRTLAG